MYHTLNYYLAYRIHIYVLFCRYNIVDATHETCGQIFLTVSTEGNNGDAHPQSALSLLTEDEEKVYTMKQAVKPATQAYSYDNIGTTATVSSQYEHNVISTGLSKPLDADTEESHTLSYVLSEEDCTTLHELKATLHSLQHSLEALNNTADDTVSPPLTIHPPVRVSTDLGTPNLEPVAIESAETETITDVHTASLTEPTLADIVADAVVFSSVEQPTISEDMREVDKSEADDYAVAEGEEQSTLSGTRVRAEQALEALSPLPTDDLRLLPLSPPSPSLLLPVEAYFAEANFDVAATSVDARPVDLSETSTSLVTEVINTQMKNSVEEEEVVDHEVEVTVTEVELVGAHSSDVASTQTISLSQIATDQQSNGQFDEQASSVDEKEELAVVADLIPISPSSSPPVEQIASIATPLSDDSHAVDTAVRLVDELVEGEEDALARFEAYFTPRTSSSKSSSSYYSGNRDNSIKRTSPLLEASFADANVAAIAVHVEVALPAPSPDTVISSAVSHRTERVALGNEPDPAEALYVWDHSYALHPEDEDDDRAVKVSLLGGESEQHDVLVHIHTEKEATTLPTIIPSPASSTPPLTSGDMAAVASPDLSSRSTREVQVDAPVLEELEEVIFAAPSDDYKPPSSGSSVDLVDVDGGRCEGRVQSTATAHAAVSARISDKGILGLGEVTESEITIREREVNPVLSAPGYSTGTPSMMPTEAITIPTTPSARPSSPVTPAPALPYSPPTSTDHIQPHQPRPSVLASPPVKPPLPKPPSIDIASLVRKVLLQPPLPSPITTKPPQQQQPQQLITTASNLPSTSSLTPASQRTLYHRTSGSSSTRQRTFLDLETDRVSRVMLRGTCEDIHT